MIFVSKGTRHCSSADFLCEALRRRVYEDVYLAVAVSKFYVPQLRKNSPNLILVEAHHPGLGCAAKALQEVAQMIRLCHGLLFGVECMGEEYLQKDVVAHLDRNRSHRQSAFVETLQQVIEVRLAVVEIAQDLLEEK